MDRLSVLLLALFSFPALSLPADDKDFSCTSAATAERYIQELSIHIESFGGTELCSSHVDSKRLFNDLRLIEEGQFSPSKENIFIQNFVPASAYYSWLVQQTRGIERGNDIPWATAYNSWGYFTMQDGWAKLSTLGRVGTLIHEARHTEGYSHTTCDHGPYKDSNVAGCDESVAAGGSHGVEMEYYARVHLQGSNFHPAYQAMARLMLLARSNFVFNENPAATKDALLVRTDSGLLRLDESGLTRLPFPADLPNATVLKRTSLGATFLALPSGAWALDLVQPEAAITLSDDYSYYKLLKMTPPADLMDMEEFDFGLRRFLYAVDEVGHLFAYVFGQGAWSQSSAPQNINVLMTSDPAGRSGLFALFRDATYCPIQPPQLTCAEAPSAWPAGAKKVVDFRKFILKLGPDGKVYDSSGASWPELDGETVLDMVVVPEYSVFD